MMYKKDKRSLRLVHGVCCCFLLLWVAVASFWAGGGGCAGGCAVYFGCCECVRVLDSVFFCKFASDPLLFECNQDMLMGANVVKGSGSC